MPWEVELRTKRKDDVHGIAVLLHHTGADARVPYEDLECSRVAFWRRRETAARHKEDFGKVLEDEVAKAEKAAEVMNRYQARYDQAAAEARLEARNAARKELAAIWPERKAGTPEFE